jgi:hypothetical protein
MTTKQLHTAEELDALHDAGVDMTPYVDLSTARRPGLETHRVNVDFPQWMVSRLDHEADRRGITRQSMIKYWISERLDAARLDAPRLAEDPAPYGAPPPTRPRKKSR